MHPAATTPNSPEPRRRRLPEERPQQIIEAAFTVFGEKGLGGARLDDIAKRAGVSKGTIYLYFPNKEALFCEMIREMVGRTIERTEARIVSSHGTASEQLGEYMRSLWEYTRSRIFEILYRLTMGELHHFPALLQFFMEEVAMRSMRVTADIVRRGVASGQFRPIEPMVAARLLHSLVVKHGVWCAQRDRIPFMVDLRDDEVFEQLKDFYFHAIRANP